LRRTPHWADISAAVWAQEGAAHGQPMGTGLPAVKYLAPYIFRVALSNNRIVKLAHGQVTFRYRASATGQTKLCALDAEELIPRFWQHVLPKGFFKVRYGGFFGPGRRPQLTALRQLLGATPAAPRPASTVGSCSRPRDSGPRAGVALSRL